MHSPADAIRLRNREHQKRSGIDRPLAHVPDEELIATLVAYGQPRHAAEEVKTNPQVRLFALLFWTDVYDAGHGDPEAKQRVDYCRQSWERLRLEELIADDPRRVTGDLIDPAELL